MTNPNWGILSLIEFKAIKLSFGCKSHIFGSRGTRFGVFLNSVELLGLAGFAGVHIEANLGYRSPLLQL